ncbi:MAG: EAL domain-containing protein [Epsilonproteobacteria bacterium]|nr:EAL domain-containing protein [Campylobacterota bacterium]
MKKENIFLDLLRRSKKNANLSQAVARFAIATFFLLLSIFLYKSPDHEYMPLIASIYFVYAHFSLYIEYKMPKNNMKRKVLNMVADFGAQSSFIYTSGLAAVFVYPFILWVIMGNGLRFGSKYLYIALGISMTFFGLATSLNADWQTHKEFLISMTLGLVVLTFFYSTLIKKIHTLNATLENKVKERTAQLKYRLYHDQLTKLKNRTALQSDLKKEPFTALFLIDIDKFRNFNDLYGMEVGNTILLSCVKYLSNLYEEQEEGIELYRIYGDGFVLRIKHNKNDDLANPHAHKIISHLTKQSHFSMFLQKINEKINIDFTTVAVYQQENALVKADMGLKYAKKINKPYVDYHNEMDSTKEIENNLYWKNEIQEAIKNDNILPVFQPIVGSHGEIIKYEALMRLQQGDKLISPFFFLDVAIKTKQYEKLTSIMIEKSFTFMAKFGKDFSINLSFVDIKNESLIRHLMHKIQEYHIGSQLIIEIVESEDVEDFIIVQNFVKNIRKLGVRVAIDDFGSGYSNYNHVLQIMPDCIKIDGSLIKNIDQDDNASKLVESIIFLAKKLEITTIAEYVHSEEVFDVCKKLGIDEFQGFYFSEPLPIEKIEETTLVAL